MVDPKTIKYRNITISGMICTGTSTLSGQLIEKLGWKHWNAGQFFRDYCKENKLKLENTSDRSDDLARQVEYGMRKDLQEKSGQLMEAWLSGFVAQGLKGVLKVLLVCDDSLRVDRFVNREGVKVEEAKDHLRKREHENAKKWTRVYKNEWAKWVAKDKQLLRREKNFFDFWHPDLYDLVIDTYSNSKEETLHTVLKSLSL
ncbi:MAG: cytidylate kinase family protein [Candidatus Beckwithbacteria bacterium]|nr:cytidylate kinase family protein [Patescibacteria group bacterium]